MKTESFIPFVTLCKREIRRYFVVFSQTILPPLVSSTLFIFVFGYSIGKNIDLGLGSIKYLDFMIPGLVMMHLIEGSYTNTSSSLFMSRWHNLIQEMLLSPLSYIEMVFGLIIGGMTRAMITSCGVFLISRFFTQFPIHDVWVVIYFFLTVTFIFSCLGLLVGLWAEGFENLSVWGTFVITPLIYFGGVFHKIDMVPGPLQFLTKLNPMHYLINGIRYGMIGVTDAPIEICVLFAAVLCVILFLIVERLFRIGYKLRK